MRNYDDSLLRKAKTDLWNVDLILKNLTGDENELNLAAYHLHQALEKTMKHVISMSGIKPQYIHDLFEIYSGNIDLFHDISETLRCRLDTITRWEAKTRYVIGYTAELNAIKQIKPLIEKYYSDVLAKEPTKEEAMIVPTSEFK